MRTRALLILFLMLLTLAPAGGAAPAANFGGVGIDGVPLADGEIAVRQLVTGGPAQLAGIRIGDVITHIDGIPTRGSDFRHLVSRRLRGRTGTRVLLAIRRSGQAQPLRFALVRRELVTAGT